MKPELIFTLFILILCIVGLIYNNFNGYWLVLSFICITSLLFTKSSLVRISVVLVLLCGIYKLSYSQTTAYVIEPPYKTMTVCDSITTAKWCIQNRNVPTSYYQANRQIWISPKGSKFILMVPRTGGCTYKKYLKALN